MASRTNESVVICSRKQAIEMIPVAITRAKYPGNKSATARERTFGGFELFISGRFFIAAFAIELETNV